MNTNDHSSARRAELAKAGCRALRRRAISLLRCAGLAAVIIAARGQPWSEIEAGFQQPPASAKPKTFWFWMNGNVSRDGITRDLEAMARVGIGEALMFDGGTYLPAGPAGYLSPLWRELLTHAVNEGERVGVKVGMHNAPGWSSSGGPWVTPERAMQQLVWTETTVPSGAAVDLMLRQPHTNLGFYRDAAVLAFPTPAAEARRWGEAVKNVRTVRGTGDSSAASAGKAREQDALAATDTGRTPVPLEQLSDGDFSTAIAVSPQESLEFELTEPTTIQAVTVFPPRGRGFPTVQIEISEDGVEFRRVATVRNPGKHGIQPPGVASFAPVRARFVRAVPTGAGEIGDLLLHRGPRLEDWQFKANFAFRVGRQMEIPGVDANAAAQAIDPARVVDLTAQLTAEGQLRWDAPALPEGGTWTIQRLGFTPTGQLNVSASAAGTGLEIDKLDAAATEFHFEHVIKRVMADAGDLAGRTFASVAIDSYEAGMQNWTAAFPDEFRRRTGYDLRGYLPAMAGGRVVGDAARSERFLFDVRRVQADMMAEFYYGRMRALCERNGLTLYVEGYGQGVLDELQVSGVPHVPMTEFWQRTPWSPNRTMKLVTSAAHIYAKPIVASEAFTGEEQTSRYLEYPYSLKALGDVMFGHGLNQLVFHRYAHQPHPDAVPGMAMGPWGFHFDRTNTWFEQSRGWLSYLARSQWMLRQGAYVADVLYFVGERPPNVAQYATPVLPPGHNYDLINEEVLLTRARVREGRIVLEHDESAGASVPATPDESGHKAPPTAMPSASYRVLLLPEDLKGVTPEVMRKLRELVGEGAIIVGAKKPADSLTLRGFPESDAEVRRTADELWESGVTASAGGRPRKVIADRSIAEVLRQRVKPDFEYTGERPDAAVSWTHRALPDADIYFIANRQRRVDHIVASFRIVDRRPEIWRPETGEVTSAAVYAFTADRTRLPVQLGPSESVFVVFRKPATLAPAGALTKDGQPLIEAVPFAEKKRSAVANTFTMSIWVKPDIDLRLLPREATTGKLDETGKFYAIPAAEGDGVQGAGHAMAGLAVGRNGVYVVERSKDHSPAVLVAPMPIAGWTHVAVAYRGGRPSLFVNGKFVREGLASGSTVHPGIGSPPPRPETAFHFAGLANVMRASGKPPLPSQGLAYYFEGNLTPAELHERALTESEIAEIAARGLPEPAAPKLPEVRLREDGGAEALVWESGAYALGRRAPVSVEVPAPRTIEGPWRVSFPTNRGTSPSITLAKLESLHRHADSGVKHFSGTARYERSFDVPVEFLAANRRVLLDLGRVEVVAEVRVNGRDAGLAWKEPYRIDVTEFVRAGTNSLEVAVTNLWTNRLIGDEQLPGEHEYRSGDERGITKIPAWYATGGPKPPGGRVTFSTWKFYAADEPLVESGLLGPVRLLNSVRVEFSAELAAGASEWKEHPLAGARSHENFVTTPDAPISPEEMQRIYDEVKTPFKYGVVLKGGANEMLDCPSVFRFGGKWFMLYVAIKDEIGYETFLAESDDLLSWRPRGKVLSFAKEGWDAWQADGGISLVDPMWGGSMEPERFAGKYWMSYIGGAKQGYEPDPLAIGLASTMTPDVAREWTRWVRNPVLHREQPDVRPWESVTLYKSTIIRDRARTLGHPFVMFYNGKTKQANHEAIGLAVSDDLVTWRRFGGDEPVVDNAPGKPAISGDPQIVKIGDLWVMFYFGFRWKPNAFDTFAVSRDLVNWTKWEGPHLVEPSEPWDKTFAHKPWVLKHEGVVYHFYCAVGDQGRVIALATSKDWKREPR